MRSIVLLLSLLSLTAFVTGNRHDHSVSRIKSMINSVDSSIQQSVDDIDSPFYVWPLPAEYTFGSGLLYISHDFRIEASPMSDDMQHAIDRYTRMIFTHRTRPNNDMSFASNAASQLSKLTVTIADSHAALQMGVDESYTLTVADDGSDAVITAQTFYGALHGLETFSQLITFDFDKSLYQVNQVPITIKDKPRFTHRGFLIDTSRHYQSIDTIKQFIDSLTMAKFNVLHWHMVDDQSFPYHSQALPHFSKAAYRPVDRYSTYDVEDIVAYSRVRGIRVMMEIDVPGHESSWCVGYPEVCPDPKCTSPLDPSQNATFAVMQRLFGELTGGKARSGLIPEDLFHLGGDEVNLGCYNSVPRVKSWLAERSMTANDGYRYMVDRAQQMIHSMGRQAVNWQEVYQNFGKLINQSTIIHVWKSPDLVYNVTRDGFRVLFSPDTPYYLNHVDLKWQDMYTLEPTANLAEKQAALVLGGEACLWGEYVDGGDMQSTAWPRAAAIAERLWSPQQVNNVTAAEPRYANFRCMLNGRGVAASLTQQSARVAPLGPGPCLSQ